MDRCPTCQGPAVADAGKPGGIRCRNSLCTHNHSEQKCPRCGVQDLESVTYKNALYEYTCRDCLHKWTVAS